MADVGSGLAHLRAWVPATSEGALGALYSVARALELAFQPETAPVESLGWRTLVQDQPMPVALRLSVRGGFAQQVPC
jgi:hypothetical protein